MIPPNTGMENLFGPFSILPVRSAFVLLFILFFKARQGLFLNLATDWIKVSSNWLLKSFVSRKKKSTTYEKCKFHSNCFNWFTTWIELQSRACHFRAGSIAAALWPLGLATWRIPQPPTRGRKGSVTVCKSRDYPWRIVRKSLHQTLSKGGREVSALLLPVLKAAGCFPCVWSLAAAPTVLNTPLTDT